MIYSYLHPVQIASQTRDQIAKQLTKSLASIAARSKKISQVLRNKLREKVLEHFKIISEILWDTETNHENSITREYKQGKGADIQYLLRHIIVIGIASMVCL